MTLRANRLSLNVDKTKLIIFRSKYSKNNYEEISIKLQGIRLAPSKYVKYLGIYIDENLSWDIHIQKLSNKLSRANGLLSKLHHYIPKYTLISVYYALFYSHLIYGCSVSSLTSQKNINIINILQKKCIRVINFSHFNDHTNLLFVDNNLLKFKDIINLCLLVLVNQFNNNKLPIDLKDIFVYTREVHIVTLHKTQLLSVYICL